MLIITPVKAITEEIRAARTSLDRPVNNPMAMTSFIASYHEFTGKESET
jgi:hypothetical protein